MKFCRPCREEREAARRLSRFRFENLGHPLRGHDNGSAFSPDNTTEVAEGSGDDEVNQAPQPEVAAECQGHTRAQQPDENSNQEPVKDATSLGAPRDDECRYEREQHLEVGYYPRANPGGEMTDGRLVGSATSLDRQDECVGRGHEHRDEKTHRNHADRGTENAKPTDVRYRFVHLNDTGIESIER